MQMLHSFGLKMKKSRTIDFSEASHTSDWWDQNGPIINLDAGRFLFQQRYYLNIWKCILQLNLYNEDLGLTNLSFSYSSNIKIQSNMKKNLNIS